MTTITTNRQASTTQQPHLISKNIKSFYIHFEETDWDSKRAIITQLDKQYPQLEVKKGKQNTPITIKAHNKESFIVLAKTSYFNNRNLICP